MPDLMQPIDRQQVASLKREFFRLMRRHREMKYGAPVAYSNADAGIAAQIRAQNAVLSEAAEVAGRIDELLGQPWDWIAEEAEQDA